MGKKVKGPWTVLSDSVVHPSFSLCLSLTQYSGPGNLSLLPQMAYCAEMQSTSQSSGKAQGKATPS